jgi:hypothetical protein
MTAQERDYEAILSRVLHTTTDQLEPVGDGLTKIRARLDEPWLKRQWWLLRSGFMALGWLVVVRYEAFSSTVKSGKPGKPGSAAPDSAAGPLAALLACATPDTEEHGRRRRSLRPVLSRLTAWVASRGPGRGHEDGPRSSHGPVVNWLRPALAVAGAVVIVVGGVFALGNIQKGFGFIGLGADGASQPGASSQTGGPGNTQGGGTLNNSRSPSQGRSGTPKPGASAAHGRPLPSPGPCISPSPTSAIPSPSPTSASPTPTPTTSLSPSPTPTTSPSPSPSNSQAPLTGSVGPQTQEGIGTTALVMCEQVAPTAQPSPSNQATGGP